jgi:hypothetical protein
LLPGFLSCEVPGCPADPADVGVPAGVSPLGLALERRRTDRRVTTRAKARARAARPAS